MNDNLILGRIVAKSTGRLLCVLMGMLLLLSCGSENAKEGTDGNTGNTTNQYLQLQPNGLNTVKISSRDETFVFPFQVKLMGSGANPGGKARIGVWSEDELDAYNNKEKTSYTLLPSSLYSLTSTDLTFKQGESEVGVEMKFNPSKVFAEYRKNSAEYVIALKLTSTDIQVRDRQSDIILAISFDYPTVKFTTSLQKISVNKDLVSVAVNTTLDYKIGGEPVDNPWNFLCGFSVPANAEELVAEYNNTYKSNYQLLPANNYNLGEGATFKIGDRQASGEITIKRAGLSVVDYLLPLKLGECSSDKVICNNEICYLQVGRTYTNPIISDKSVPDPTVIRAKDGYFYLYATQTKTYWMPIYRSKDLVNWEYMHTAFTQATKPNLSGGGAFWAPEVQYINGKYVLYYSWAQMNEASTSYTAVAVSDSPLGPFPNSKALITNEEFGSNVIDQFYYEEDGKKYMFFGSFTGIYVTELTDDGLFVKRGGDGKPLLKKKICGNAFEGTNIYKKNGFYYLFASIGNCCNGVNSNYKVVVGRSKDLLGPYVDKKGKGMIDNSWELVFEGDGQKWIGPGHNSIIIQDDEGTDWMIYHSYIKTGSAVGGRLGMLDRLQWSNDGWPYIKNCVPSNSDLIPVFKD